MDTDLLFIEVALPGESEPTAEPFFTRTFLDTDGKRYHINRKGELYVHAPRKKVIETGEVIQIPNTDDKEYLTDFNDVIKFESVDPARRNRSYYATFKNGRLQKLWYETTNES